MDGNSYLSQGASPALSRKISFQHVRHSSLVRSQPRDGNRTSSRLKGQNEEAQAWQGFGYYIAEKMKMGKAVHIPKLGTFTFSPADIDLSGTTNKETRDTKQRLPLFVVSKDFYQGLQTGIICGYGSLRPIGSFASNGSIPMVTSNFTDIGFRCGQSKDKAKQGVENSIRGMKELLRKHGRLEYHLPYVGQFLIKQNLCGMDFDREIVFSSRFQMSEHKIIRPQSQNEHREFVFTPSITSPSKEKVEREQREAYQFGESMFKKSQAKTPLHRPNFQERASDHKQSQRSSLHKPSKLGTIQEDLEGLPDQALFKTFSSQDEVASKIPFSGISLGSTLTGTYANLKLKKKGGSFLSGQTSINGISKLTVKFLAQEIVKNQKYIVEALSGANLDTDSSLTESEVLMFLKQVRAMNINSEYLAGLFRALNLSREQQKAETMTSSEQIKVSFKELFSRCQQLLDQLQMEKDGESQLLGHQLIRRFKDAIYLKQTTADELFKFFKNSKNRLDKNGFEQMVQSLMKDLELSFTSREIQILFSFLATRGFLQDKEKQAWNLRMGIAEVSYLNFASMCQVQEPIRDWEAVGLKKIREWMVKRQLNSKLAFDQILKFNKSIYTEHFGQEQFREAMKKEGLPFTLTQLDFLFKALDRNNDGLVDWDEWNAKVFDDFRNPLQLLREIVFANEISGEELLQKMRLKIYDDPLDYPTFQRSLRTLDPSLNHLQLKALFNELKSVHTSKVDVQTFIASLTGDIDEKVGIKGNTFKKLSEHLRRVPQGWEKLKERFEACDYQHEGMLDPLNVKMALRKMKVDLPDNELDKFIRFLDKDHQKRVDYIWFLNQVQMAGKDSKDKEVLFHTCLKRIQRFLEINKQSIPILIQKLSEKAKSHSKVNGVPCSIFGQFLRSKVFKHLDEETSREIASKADLNQDGFICEADLTSCLGNLNHQSFMKSLFPPASLSKFSREDFSSSGGLELDCQLFPREKLDEDKAIEVGRYIRNELDKKKISIRDAFSILDSKESGMLSFADFSLGLDRILKLSQPLKEKLFAKMDKLSIGLVAYENFLEVLRTTTATQIHESVADSFAFEMAAIKRIKDFSTTSKSMSVEQLFKIMDSDFDGYISKEDLRVFLESILEVRELTPVRLDRIYRVLDQNKSGNLVISDLRYLINSDSYGQWVTSQGETKYLSKSPFSSQRGASPHTLDWKTSAAKQIGLFLTKRFPDLLDAFEEMGEFQAKVTFVQFRRFLEKYNILAGYNLTHQLFQELFASVDPHKKGYLTQADFLQAFQDHNWQNQCLIELKNALANAFSDISTAFDFFVCFKGTATKTKLNLLGGEKAKIFNFQGHQTQYSMRGLSNQPSHISMNPADVPALAPKQALERRQSQGANINSTASQNIITDKDFGRGVRSLMSTRFSEKEIKLLWVSVLEEARAKGNLTSPKASQKSYLDLHSFKSVFGGMSYLGMSSSLLLNMPKMSKRSFFYRSNVPSQTLGNSGERTGEHSDALQDYISTLKHGRGQATMVDVFERLKGALKSSKFSLLDILSSPEFASPKITTIQFKNALKRTGVSLSSKDIDKLIARLDPRHLGLIDVNYLTEKIATDENQKRIEERQALKINQLLKLIQTHMSSPEDAFRMFDRNNCGKMNLSELQEMVQKLYSLALLEQPSFPIIKDIFDQLDANKDGIVDRNEWMNAFSSLCPPSQGRKELASDTTSASTHQEANSIGKWKEIKTFEDLINNVARNRKLIQDYVNKKEKSEVVTANERQLAHQLNTNLVHKKHVLQAINSSVGKEREMGRLVESLVEPFSLKEGPSQGDQLFDFGRFLEAIKQRAQEKTGFPIL